MWMVCALLCAARGARALVGTAARALRPSSTALAATAYSDETKVRVRAAGLEKRQQPLRMPARLSPTAASTFQECEQLFLFRNLWRLPEPPSPQLVRGSLVHDVLEKMFDRPVAARTHEALGDMFRDEWRAVRDSCASGVRTLEGPFRLIFAATPRLPLVDIPWDGSRRRRGCRVDIPRRPRRRRGCRVDIPRRRRRRRGCRGGGGDAATPRLPRGYIHAGEDADIPRGLIFALSTDDAGTSARSRRSSRPETRSADGASRASIC